MGKVYFLFGVHNHQPVGNFDHVFKTAFNTCYKPFIDILAKYKKVKCNVHISGPLYDWFLKNKPDFIVKIKGMVKSGQLEIVSGGYYEPILPIIPDSDKLAQIELMNEFIKKQFKQEPRGIWITERVWEPYLPRILNQAKLKYAFLDDTHFRYAGIDKDEFFGYYTTEEDLKAVSIFPISKQLRYKIPFSQAHESIDLLKSFAKDEDVLVTLFDDGEKFGLWPHTYDWIYKQGWLNNFFKALSDNFDSIETIKASDALLKFKSQGLVYLPTASYEEMGEWALEPHSLHNLKDLQEYVKNSGQEAKFSNFIRGGFFRNFYEKYPRLNFMHKKMFSLSQKINKKLSPKTSKQIFKDLWMGQCNCGYWHGIFGGFYLGHIRAAIYESLIKAEKAFDIKQFDKFPIAEEYDLDLDGHNETVVKNEHLICTLSDKGGALVELSFKPRNFNFLNTITRRVESYHKKVRENVTSDGSKHASIHDGAQCKEAGLDKYLIYDTYEKVALVDHLLNKNLSLEDFSLNKNFKTLGNFPYESKISRKTGNVKVEYQYKGENIGFSKQFNFSKKSLFEVEYRFKNNRFFKETDFGIEFNLFFQSPESVLFSSNSGKIRGTKEKVFKGATSLIIRDEFKKVSLDFGFDKADIIIIPLYSVSSSEGGFEKGYQQTTILFINKENVDSFKLACLIR